MKVALKIVTAGMIIGLSFSCNPKKNEATENPKTKNLEVTAKDILGNPDYPAISYGGYRKKSREVEPTLDQLEEDMKILSALGIRVLRTYNVHLQEASNLLQTIRQMKKDDPEFEMYVMLGAWIKCKNAMSDLPPDHAVESEENEVEIARAVKLASEYPDIVKILAVGNEAMVKWAESYYVQPAVILKWVNHLQSLKKAGTLPEKLWITSSDDFASWGGGGPEYHTEDLAKLVHAVDYISMHTYPYHNTHYNPNFWRVPHEQNKQTTLEQVDAAMVRAKEFAKAQYMAVTHYVKSLGVEKPIHIGETGWATVSDGFYGVDGAKSSDEYKQGLYYKHMREWTSAAGISCFYFEAFDEQWKDAGNSMGSENHFGLFTLTGQAKYPVWAMVDQGIFNGLKRDGNTIEKTYNGDLEALLAEVMAPPLQ